MTEGCLWSAMNAVGLGRIDDARAFVREGHAVKPDMSFELAQTCLGTMAPDVGRGSSLPYGKQA